MLVMLSLAFLAALLFVYIFMPTLLISIMSVDESLDAHEAGLAVVATRHPFRESSEPVCMAKLLMLRQKINQTNNRKRRNVSHTRHAARIISLQSTNRPNASWARFGKQFGKQYH